MTISATLTETVPAPADAYSARDEAASDSGKLDFHDLPRVNALLDAGLPAAQRKIEAAARKLGMRVPDKPDVGYGAHIGRSGPIDFWYQMRFK